jgi:predicted DNA-binding transcriptional regulator YafY
MPSTTERLLALLSLLQARRDWPAQTLAERLEVSARTIRRDVERLRGMGYRVAAIKGPDGGYRLHAGTDLPPLLFDEGQAVALAVALRTAAAMGAGVGEDALRALTTVRQLLPAHLGHRVDALDVAAVPPSPAASADPAVLVAVATATRDGEVLRFDYGRVDAPARRVEPHHVLAAGGIWYLVAWDLEHGDWRIFRVDRLTPRAPTGRRFVRREVPGGDARVFLVARFRGADPGSGGADWPCRGSVVLDLPAVRVRPFARDGVVEDLGDGRTRLTLGSWSWAGLAAALVAFDTDLHDPEPRELADAFSAIGARLARSAAEGRLGAETVR